MNIIITLPFFALVPRCRLYFFTFTLSIRSTTPSFLFIYTESLPQMYTLLLLLLYIFITQVLTLVAHLDFLLPVICIVRFTLKFLFVLQVP